MYALTRFWSIFIVLLLLSARLPASISQDSLHLALSQMPERERVQFINTHLNDFFSVNFDLALELGKNALDIAQKNHWPELEALTLKNIGIVYYLKGNYDEPLHYYQQALDLYERAGNRTGQGEVLKEMGNYFKRINRHDKALEQLERAIALCAEAKDTLCLAAGLDIKGVVLLEQGKLNEAEAIFKQEMTLLETLNDEKALSYTFNNLAEVAIGKKQFDRAERYLAQSTAIRKKIGDAHGVAINVNNTGEMLLKSGHPARALPLFEETLRLTEKIGFTDLQRHAMQMLSETCIALGNYEKAMGWLQKSYALKDSLFSVEMSRQVAEMSEKYETEKKEKELALQQRKIQRRNFLLAFSLASFAVLALAFVWFFRQQKHKQALLQREAALKTELVKRKLSLRLQDERLRISRDLHDNLGAELTIIGGSLAQKVATADSPAEKAALEAIRQSARQAMAQLRETIWAIRYEQFTIQDLADKIADFASRATTLPLYISLPQELLHLSPSQTLNLFRIAQEAITNTTKYANATSLELSFEYTTDQKLVMCIADNGIGFDPQTQRPGNGLENMKARAIELGGEWRLDSHLSTGVRITVVIPTASGQA